MPFDYSNNPTTDTQHAAIREAARKAASILGKLGGSAKSEKKTLACRANAKKKRTRTEKAPLNEQG